MVARVVAEVVADVLRKSLTAVFAAFARHPHSTLLLRRPTTATPPWVRHGLRVASSTDVDFCGQRPRYKAADYSGPFCTASIASGRDQGWPVARSRGPRHGHSCKV